MRQTSHHTVEFRVTTESVEALNNMRAAMEQIENIDDTTEVEEVWD